MTGYLNQKIDTAVVSDRLAHTSHVMRQFRLYRIPFALSGCAVRLMTGLSFFLAGTSAMMAQDLPSFAIISGQTVTNTGATTIKGNIAVSPGTAYTGAGTVTQDGAIFLGDAVAARIQSDLVTLYTYLSGLPTSSGGNLTGQDLNGQVLGPGVYNFDSSANLATNGVLTFDAGGNPNAVFILNIGSTLTAGSGSTIRLINGAQGGNVFYRVGSSATLDTSSELEGQIVALTSISMNAAAQITCGAAYARNGSVTLIANTIQICTLKIDADVPDPDPDIEPGPDPEPDLEPEPDVDVVAVVDIAPGRVIDTSALPISIAILVATQTPAELAISLSQLSGEVATGLAPTSIQSMDAFLDVVMGRGRRPDLQLISPRDEGVPPGMVVDKVNAPYLSGKGSTAAPIVEDQALSFSTILAEQTQPFNVWASAYGSRSVTDGDAGLGSSERRSDTQGFAAGVNYAPSARTDIGLALSWNTADFSLNDGSSSGMSDAIFAAIRGRSSSTTGYVEGALAYGQHDLTTDRSVTIAGFDRLRGETKATHVAAHVEAGYYLGQITPFIALRAQSFKTYAYSEMATVGVDTYALSYGAHTTESLRSELGVQMQWNTAQVAGRATSVGLRAAWAHEFVTLDPTRGTLVTTPGIGFPVSGAQKDSDALLWAASIGTWAANGIFVQGGVNGEYSNNSQDFGGSITVGYRW